VVEKKSREVKTEVKDYEEDTGNDPNSNPTYADALLNLLQNVPNLILSMLNIRLIGYSY